LVMASPKTAAWLQQYGWRPGMGLGKQLNGRKDIITVTKKDDKLGLGKHDYSLFDYGHWDKLYNDAAKKIQVSSGSQGAKLLVADTPKPLPAVYKGMFVKSTSTLNTTASEQDLFGHCGNRELRIFRQEGKMSRLKKFETGGELEYKEYFEDFEKNNELLKEQVEENLEKKTNFQPSVKKGKKRKREKTKNICEEITAEKTKHNKVNPKKKSGKWPRKQKTKKKKRQINEFNTLLQPYVARSYCTYIIIKILIVPVVAGVIKVIRLFICVFHNNIVLASSLFTR